MTFRIEASASEWIDALKAVQPHAATGRDALPALAAVRLDADDTGVYLLATDRYTLIMRRMEAEALRPVTLESGGPGWQSGASGAVLLEMGDVKRVLSLAADFVRISVPLTLDVTGDTLEMLTFTTPAASATFRAVGETYPPVRTILRDAVETIEADDGRPADLAFNPAQLAKWAKACGKHDTIAVRYTRPNRVALVVGSNFIGAQMCIRSNGFSVPDWAPPQPAAKRDEVAA